MCVYGRPVDAGGPVSTARNPYTKTETCRRPTETQPGSPPGGRPAAMIINWERGKPAHAGDPRSLTYLFPGKTNSVGCRPNMQSTANFPCKRTRLKITTPRCKSHAFFYCTVWPCCPVRSLRRALPASHPRWTLSIASHLGRHATNWRLPSTHSCRDPSVKNLN